MSMGYVVGGRFIKKAGNASIMNLPLSTDTDPGLLSPEEKQTIEKSYTTEDVASTETINSLFD